MGSEALIESLAIQAGRQTLLTALAVDLNGDADMRWADGFIFRREPCSGGGVLPLSCRGDSTEMDPGDPAVGEGSVTGEPFFVWAADVCSTFGFEAVEYENRARNLLESSLSYHIARELWTGAQTGSPSSVTLKNRQLAHTASDELTTTGIAPKAAIACFDQALATCGMNRRGIIHMTPQARSSAAVDGAIRREGAQWLSPNDNLVVADGGYLGSAPSTPGTTPTTSQWAYATSWMGVRLGPVETFGGPISGEGGVTGLAMATNTVYTWALRPAMVQWDHCCHFAAELALPVCAGA